MEVLERTVGLRTILLVQFQPQYIAILLAGIYFSCYVVIKDVADSYIHKQKEYIPSQNELLTAFDCIYGFDILTMTIYKFCDWEEAKQVFASRHCVFILIEIVSCLPVCHIYQRATGTFSITSVYLRFRVLLRMLRIGYFFMLIRKHAGNATFRNVMLEFLILITLYIMIVNLVFIILSVIEEFVVQSYFLGLYGTIARIAGKGAPSSETMPHNAMLPLLICTFINYLIYITYVGFFIAALMIGMKSQFFFVNGLTKVMSVVQKWRYHSVQMYKTVQMFYTVTWAKRESLLRFDTFDYIIPDIMKKEIKLDICWDAFKHSHIFRNMEVHYLRYLSTLMTITFFTPGELIYKKGKFKSRMVYVISGVIQLLSEEDGETPILSFSGGTCLGETTLFVDQPSSCTVVSKTYSEVIVFERKDFFKSYDVYPDEFLFMLKTVFHRYFEAKHFLKINRYQIKNSLGDAKSQVLTMKWLKRSLYKMVDANTDAEKMHIATVNLDDRLYESSFDSLIFCARFLDLMVIANEYQMCTDTIILKYTCPIIFQPNSPLLVIWRKLIGFLSLLIIFSYVHYVCTTIELVNYYTLFIYFITFIWVLDLYIQCSTAIVTRDTVVTETSKIIIFHLSKPLFFVDICAAFPMELLCYIMMGEMEPTIFHIVKANRIIKCYRVFDLFDISTTKSATVIVMLKYLKLLFGVLAMVTNIAGFVHLSMCSADKCVYAFERFLEIRHIDSSSTLQKVVMCHFLSLQFMGGLLLGTFPPERSTVFVVIQMIYYVADMYLLADVAAAETLRNKDILKYHEFVSNVNIVMKQWDFSRDFKKRVMKYCVLQWDYDNASYLLYQDKLFAHVPFDLFKIGSHISFARSVSHLPLFQQLPDEVIAMICAHTERNMLPAGEVITYSGEVCKEMYVIESGYCQMIAQSRTTAKILGPGDSFSVLETCLNVSTINTVITLSNCLILSLSYENYLQTMRYYPHVLTEINTILSMSIDWVGFEQLMGKEFLDIESYTPDIKSFNKFGYNLDKDSKEYEDFHIPFDKVYVLKVFKYLLLRLTIKPNGSFIKYWEFLRSLFACMTCVLCPLVVFRTHFVLLYFSIALDLTAWIDIYVRHHIAYFNDIGIEIKHPLLSAVYYWKHGFAMDLLGVCPFEYLIPLVSRTTASGRTFTFLRLPRLIQGIRVYNMFNYFIAKSGNKIWIISKYFLMVVYFQLILSFLIINTKCDFDENTTKDETFSFGVLCQVDSWITPKESFQLPLQPIRVYAYGIYFLAKITTFKALEGFTVIMYSECVEIIIIIILWLCLFPYFNSKLIASIMYRNVELVVYQNAMSALVKFMRFRKIDPILKNEVIEHFEHIWHKKKGRNECQLFKVFNIALHEDALYHIYGKVMQESSIFKGASKSFFKSLLLSVKHEIVLKRGIISRVNNVTGKVFLLFKGEVQVLGPDYNKLLTLPTGSVFGHLDNIYKGRQTLTYIAKGHVELLTIPSKYFHSILAKYRGIRTHFKSMTAINVDYLINTNKVVIPDHILEDPEYKAMQEMQRNERRKKSNKSKNKKREKQARMSKRKARCIKCCKSCRHCFLNVFSRVHVRGTLLKIWEAIVLGVVCFIGSIFEFYQKSSHDISISILGVLYATDVLFLLKIYLEFHTAYDDERGLLVKNRKQIAKRYLKKMLGFRIDFISIVPFEVICFFFSGDDYTKAFTYGRLLRLLRIIMVIEFFHNVNQKLNINVLVMRFLYLMVCVTLMLQFLVCLLFFCAKFDYTMEYFSAHLTENYRFMMYLRQIRVILHMFTGSQIDIYRPNTVALITTTSVMMIFTRFIIAIFIAETCATLETVMHNKSNYEAKILTLKRNTTRSGVSLPLYRRMWMYVTLLWIHHKGEQFPYLLSEAPYYLREGVLDSMFGFHIRTHTILRKCHSDLIRQMAACMTTRIFFTGDFIAFVGDIDECMYFIHEGEVCVLSEDSINSETIEKTLTSGESFGLEQGLYKRCGHEYTYRANSYSVIVMLNRKHWIHLLDYFPASKYLIFDKQYEKQLLKRHDLTKPKNLGKPRLPNMTPYRQKKRKTFAFAKNATEFDFDRATVSTARTK